MINNNNDNNEYRDYDKNVYKYIIIGDSSVGKSSFIIKLCHNIYHNVNPQTIGVAYFTKNLVDTNTNLIKKFTFWDTAGQERFQSIVSMYYKNVTGVICMYDINNYKTLENTEKWIENFFEKTNIDNETFPILLLGNKLDLINEYNNNTKANNIFVNKLKKKFNIHHYTLSVKNYDQSDIENIVYDYSSYTTPIVIAKKIITKQTDSCKCY